MEIEQKIVNLNEIHENKDNPRKSSKIKLEQLVNSLKKFPEMLEIREIVVDENMMILGGNMRYRALKKLGEKTAPIKIIRGLTDEQKREFIIKDNNNYGEWDTDLLKEWDVEELNSWDLVINWDLINTDIEILEPEGCDKKGNGNFMEPSSKNTVMYIDKYFGVIDKKLAFDVVEKLGLIEDDKENNSVIFNKLLKDILK